MFDNVVNPFLEDRWHWYKSKDKGLFCKNKYYGNPLPTLNCVMFKTPPVIRVRAWARSYDPQALGTSRLCVYHQSGYTGPTKVDILHYENFSFTVIKASHYNGYCHFGLSRSQLDRKESIRNIPTWLFIFWYSNDSMHDGIHNAMFPVVISNIQALTENVCQ